MAEFSDPYFLILTDVGLFPCIIFKTSNIERSSHSVHSEVFSAVHGNKMYASRPYIEQCPGCRSYRYFAIFPDELNYWLVKETQYFFCLKFGTFK